MRYFITLLVFLLSGYLVKSQNSLCSGATLFCPNPTVTYPAGVNTGSGESGPNYNCLGSQPNPAWYYLNVALGGSIQIGINGLYDVDFICYGPFTSLTGACSNLTASTTVGCSYSGSNSETLTINSCSAGDFFLVMITNFSNAVQSVTLSQISGNAVLNCTQFSVSNASTCIGEAAVINATLSGLASPMYTLMPGNLISGMPSFTVSPATSTNYTLFASGINTLSSMQTYSSPVSVIVYPNPTVNVFPPTDTLCVGGAVQLNFNGALTYTWANGPVTTANTMVVGPNVTTIYTVTGSSFFGCRDTVTIPIVVFSCTGLLESYKNANEIILSPNPASNEVKISFTGTTALKAYTIEIRNCLGQLVTGSCFIKDDGSFDIQCLPVGIYIVSAKINNSIYLQRLVVYR